jgi:hypothetical protein
VAGSLTACGNLSGANTVMTDPDFNARVVRVTAANTNPGHLNFTYSAGVGGSGDVQVWNKDSTLFLLSDQGGNYYPFSFNSMSMQAAPLYGTSPNLYQTGPGEFSAANADHFYSFVGGNSTLIKIYEFTDRVNRPTPAQLFDFSNCGISSVTWKTMGGVNSDDTIFAEAFSNAGGQDTGVLGGGLFGSRKRLFYKRGCQEHSFPPPEARLWFAASSPLSDRSDARV